MYGIFAAVGVICTLLLNTSAFVAYRSFIIRACPGLYVAKPFNGQGVCGGKLLEHRGYTRSIFGDILLVCWLATPSVGLIYTMVWSGISYHADKFGDYDMILTDWLFIFSVTHLIALVIVFSYSSARNLFLLPAEIGSASYISIKPTKIVHHQRGLRKSTKHVSTHTDIPNRTGEANSFHMHSFREPSGLVTRSIIRVFTQFINSLQSTSSVSLVKVSHDLLDVEYGSYRWISFCCMRYVYYPKSGQFKAVLTSSDLQEFIKDMRPDSQGHQIYGQTRVETFSKKQLDGVIASLSPMNCDQQPCELSSFVTPKGNSYKMAELLLKVCGKNEMNIEVPSIWNCLANEFMSFVYIIQSIGAWSYVIFDAWNIGGIWLILMFTSGLTTSLLIVRPNRIRIAQMAKTVVKCDARSPTYEEPVNNKRFLCIGGHISSFTKWVISRCQNIFGKIRRTPDSEVVPGSGIHPLRSGSSHMTLEKTPRDSNKFHHRMHSYQVYREFKWVTVPLEYLVLDDIVRFSDEDTVVPCDGYMIHGTLVVNESLITGESSMIQKSSSLGVTEGRYDVSSRVFCGTEIVFALHEPTMRITAVGAFTVKSSLLRTILIAAEKDDVVACTEDSSLETPLANRIETEGPRRSNILDQLPIVYFLLFIYSLLLSIVWVTSTDIGSNVVTAILVVNTLAQCLNPMLPVSINMAHSFSSRRLQKEKGITCTNPSRIALAGNLSVMVLDKSGTITKTELEVAAYVDLLGGLSHDGDTHVDHHSESDSHLESISAKEKDLHASHSFLDLDALFASSKIPNLTSDIIRMTFKCCHSVSILPNGDMIGNNVDIAIASLSQKIENNPSTINHPRESQDFEIISQMQFDHQRLTSGAIIRDTREGRHKDLYVIFKGSFDAIMKRCPRVLDEYLFETPSVNGNENEHKNHLEAIIEYYSSRNYYIVCTAYKKLIGGADVTKYTREELERDLKFCGIILFLNLMKDDSVAAINELTEGGIRSVICTGDGVHTAVSVAVTCGIARESHTMIGSIQKSNNFVTENIQKLLPIDVMHPLDNVIVWSPFANANAISMTTDEIVNRLATNPGSFDLALTGDVLGVLSSHHTMRVHYSSIIHAAVVFARMSPTDKSTVVNALKKLGHVVGMCGDGGNDCSAIQAADIGIALSKSEVSLVAHVSSGGSESLKVVGTIIREGRACLSNNFSTFTYFVLYALLLTGCRLYGAVLANLDFGQWFYVILDVFMGVVTVSCICRRRPSDTLHRKAPSTNLFGRKSFMSIIFPVATFIIGVILVYRWSRAEETYIHADTRFLTVDSIDWKRKGDNYDGQVQFLWVLSALATHAFVASLGGKFRNAVYKDPYLCICSILMMSLVFGTLGPSSNFSCLFRVNCDSLKSLRVAQIPVIGYSSTDGCFKGPQIVLWYHEALKQNIELEIIEGNECLPPASVLKNVPNSKINTNGCVGPNNCLSSNMKIRIGVTLSVYILFQIIFFSALSFFD